MSPPDSSPARSGPIRLDRQAALIVVDVQNGFVTGGGLLVPRGEEVVPVINRIAPRLLATDFCVAWTAIDARQAGCETWVIEDATRAIDLEGSLELAWREMSACGVQRIQSSALAAG